MSNSNDDRLANLLAATATGLTDAMNDSMSEATGVDGAAVQALVALLDFAPGGTIHRLSLVLGLTHSGAVRLVDRLESAGYVQRRTGTDARSRTITLTRPGRTAARRVRAARAHASTQLTGVLTPRQRQQLSGLCEILVGEQTRQRLAQRAKGTSPAGGALCRLCDFAACGRPQGLCPAQLAAASAWSDGS
jgi:DNA-binding MarR family transcriptional regulator